MTLEGGLEAELEEELGYSRYDYRNNRTGAQSIPNRRLNPKFCVNTKMA